MDRNATLILILIIAAVVLLANQSDGLPGQIYYNLEQVIGGGSEDNKTEKESQRPKEGSAKIERSEGLPLGLSLDKLQDLLERMLAEGLRNGSIPDPLEIGDRDGTFHCHILDGKKADYCLIHTQEMPRNVIEAIKRGRNILCPLPKINGGVTFIDCKKLAQHLVGGAIRSEDIPKLVPNENVKEAGTLYFFTPDDWEESQKKDFVGRYKNCKELGYELLIFEDPDGVVNELEVVFIWCPEK